MSFRPRKSRPPKPRVKAKGGAPKGNKNALKHGRYTARTIALKRQVRRLLRDSRTALTLVKEGKYKEFQDFAANRPRLLRK